MILDMYLIGCKFYYSDETWEASKGICIDDYRVHSVNLVLGLWYNYVELHKFIIEHFADGIDNGAEIKLGPEHIRHIISAVKDKRLPQVSSPFSPNSSIDGNYTLDIFECALDWVQQSDKTHERHISYHTAWNRE